VTDDLKIALSEQFRKSAESLAQNMSLVLRKTDERDEVAISVAKLKGLLHGAELELEVRERALKQAKEITSPQSEFFLKVMEDEAQSNLTELREARERQAKVGT
jgi:hypothetical protein